MGWLSQGFRVLAFRVSGLELEDLGLRVYTFIKTRYCLSHIGCRVQGFLWVSGG